MPVHAGLRTLLCTGVFVEVAGALLEEPAVLYKEKVNYKLPGGAGYSPHQDAPAYPMIDVHVSAMVAVDDADESNGGLEFVSRCFDAVLPLDERGCIEASVVEQLDWQPVPLRAGHTLWFHSRTPHRSGPNRSDQPRRALYPTYNAAREGDLRAAYYDTKRAAFAVGTARRPRAGLAHRRLRRTPGMRVVFTVLDALPVRHVGADHTPVLDELARSGGFAAGGARAVMTSATYPNHATFSTGTGPRDHGVVTNWVPEPGRVVPAWKLPLRVPTVFDACRAGGRSSAAVLGDQHLVGVMGATTADRHWPPDGVPPDGTLLDAMGYVDDRDTVVEIVDALDAAPDLLISHLNGPDTAAHLFGPDSEGAFAGYRDTDAELAVMREHIAWDDTVWILVSDHDQENVSVREPVDLQAEIERRGLALFALPEGSASIVCGEGANAARAWLEEVDGVGGTAAIRSRRATSSSAASCGASRGAHSDSPARKPDWAPTAGRARAAQVAVVTGGHPAVEPLARAVRDDADRGRRLGADDRRAPRRRAPDGFRKTARALGAADHEVAATASTIAAQASRPGTGFPRILAASSARRSATRSSQSGMATNAFVSSGSITPPWNSSVVSLRAESTARYAASVASRYRFAATWPPTRNATRGPSKASNQLAAVDVVRGVGAQRPAVRSCARATRDRARAPRPGARRRRDARP